ncbi:hypothetical protein [Flavobacterium sp. H122]|uniref:hypothetical protein n=1 Tax=Flavobacterium sp. H122 TaxID=2529860 RepID=UPI0010AB2BA0|nr:hypothetical protein [Flavobacterium sp. H122]
MKNFLYTTGIFLLLLSPATCNYEENGLLRTETEGIVVDETTASDVYTETTETTETTSTTCEDGDPIIKPRKP